MCSQRLSLIKWPLVVYVFSMQFMCMWTSWPGRRDDMIDIQADARIPVTNCRQKQELRCILSTSRGETTVRESDVTSSVIVALPTRRCQFLSGLGSGRGCEDSSAEMRYEPVKCVDGPAVGTNVSILRTFCFYHILPPLKCSCLSLCERHLLPPSYSVCKQKRCVLAATTGIHLLVFWLCDYVSGAVNQTRAPAPRLQGHGSISDTSSSCHW